MNASSSRQARPFGRATAMLLLLGLIPAVAGTARVVAIEGSMPGTFVVAGAVGIGATLTMDLWNLFLRGVLGIASLNYCLLGRWVAHMPRGTFRHESIAAAEERPNECGLGWLVHYSIGIALAVVFVSLTQGGWLARPTPLPPLVFGLATVVLPFVIMQPSLGMGFAASKTPHPMKARLKSAVTHTIFGLGLYLSASVAEYVLT